ncbi:MAG: cytochrome c-type biogenesis protein CcmH [Gammaproteobacteria bacterium]|nr:cytochrome c-type biogenesis protein CcmH [Gammaproteobacteria bacterium]
MTHRSHYGLALLFSLLLSSFSAVATIEAYHFDDPGQEALYKELIAELRCLVCQNQNLSDSNAELALDLRRQTYEMAKAGKSREEILSYMVQRYGDFVLYRPPLQQSTLLLWSGPFIILVIAITTLVILIRRRKHEPQPLPQEADLKRARQLLQREKR